MNGCMLQHANYRNVIYRDTPAGELALDGAAARGLGEDPGPQGSRAPERPGGQARGLRICMFY